MPKINSNGTIYQRKSDKKWVVSIDLGRAENGKRKRKILYANSEAEAKKKLRDFKNDLSKHEYVNVIKTDLASYLTQWLKNEQALILKPKSLDTKEYVINRLVIPSMGGFQVGAITRDDVQSFVSGLSKRYARSTVKKAYDVLNQRFKEAVINRELISNPCAGVKLPRETETNKKEIRFFTEEEMAKILYAADATYPTGTKVCRLGKAVHLLYYTGLRAGEAIALTWDDIDFDNRIITVNKNSVNIKNREAISGDNAPKYTSVIQKSTKTKSGSRTVPMSKKAEDALMTLKELNGDSEFVLATSSGTPISIRALEKMFHGCQSRAGIENHGTLHSLRHTFASRLLEKEVDIKTVSEILGHKDVTVTYNTYIHVIQKTKMKAISKLDLL